MVDVAATLQKQHRCHWPIGLCILTPWAFALKALLGQAAPGFHVYAHVLVLSMWCMLDIVSNFGAFVVSCTIKAPVPLAWSYFANGLLPWLTCCTIIGWALCRQGGKLCHEEEDEHGAQSHTLSPVVAYAET